MALEAADDLLVDAALEEAAADDFELDCEEAEADADDFDELVVENVDVPMEPADELEPALLAEAELVLAEEVLAELVEVVPVEAELVLDPEPWPPKKVTPAMMAPTSTTAIAATAMIARPPLLPLWGCLLGAPDGPAALPAPGTTGIPAGAPC